MQPPGPRRRIKTIEGGITAPAGFKAAGVYAGIKPATHAWPLDVMLLTADRPVSAAAVFTTNKTIAAPVIVSRDNLERLEGARTGDYLQQRLRQCVHRRCRHPGGALDGRVRRASAGMPPRGSARRVNRRNRRRPEPGEGHRWRHEGARRARPGRTSQSRCSPS